jgi:hypothetical protein
VVRTTSTSKKIVIRPSNVTVEVKKRPTRRGGSWLRVRFLAGYSDGGCQAIKKCDGLRCHARGRRGIFCGWHRTWEDQWIYEDTLTNV